MALAGNLRDMALMDIIQITCQEQKQKLLTVQRGDQNAEVYFDAGEVVHASLGDLAGEEAIYRILAWDEGDFSLEEGIAPPTQTIEIPWSALLMEGLQWVDEANQVGLGDEIELLEDDMARKKTGLQDTLSELGDEVQGFIAASVVGMDGLGIAEYADDDTHDMENVNAQLTLLIKLVQTTVGKLNSGEVTDNLMSTDDAFVLIRFLHTEGYYLAIVADRRDANLGNLRLFSRIYAERLSEEMPNG